MSFRSNIFAQRKGGAATSGNIDFSSITPQYSVDLYEGSTAYSRSLAFNGDFSRFYISGFDNVLREFAIPDRSDLTTAFQNATRSAPNSDLRYSAYNNDFNELWIGRAANWQVSINSNFPSSTWPASRNNPAPFASMVIAPDNSRIFCISTYFVEYAMTTPGDYNSVVFTPVHPEVYIGGNRYGMAISPNGEYMYSVYIDGTINKYFLSNPWSFESIEFIETVGGLTNGFGLAIDWEMKILYTGGSNINSHTFEEISL